jgi:hypothetical protein
MTKHIVRARSGLLNGTAYFGPVLMDANDALARLQDRRTELFDASQALIDAADEADTDLSDEDLATINANKAAIEKLDGQISARTGAHPAGQRSSLHRRAAERRQARRPAPSSRRSRVSTTPRTASSRSATSPRRFATPAAASRMMTSPGCATSPTRPRPTATRAPAPTAASSSLRSSAASSGRRCRRRKTCSIAAPSSSPIATR